MIPFRLLLGLLLMAGAGEAAAQSPSSGFLNEAMARVLDGEAAESAFWGISVVDVETGERIYALNANRGFLPASNQKLLTAAGALLAFGPDHRFQTALYFDGTIEEGALRGDLILRGSGDPTFGSTRFDTIPDPLRAWAERLAALGVRRIEGRIIGDDDAFDDDPYAEGWDIDYVTDQGIGYAAGGLSYRDNLIRVAVEATRPGRPPELTPEVPGYLTLVNEAETTARRRGWDLDLNRVLESETVRITGTVPRRYNRELRLPVADPTRFALAAFRDHLEDAGVAAEVELVDVDALDEPLDYSGLTPLFVHLAPTLEEVLTIVNKQSNNFYAEQILRAFGYAGSAEGGDKRLKALLRQRGADADGFVMRDGSGLSRKNLITPAAMTNLLVALHGSDVGPSFRRTLARGGEARTTLRSRLGGLPVEAKTGSLQFVRALSGYATLPNGRAVAFAIFANNFTTPPYRIVQAIDQLVAAMTTS